MVRHAKSSWGDFGQKDFDRTLSERGRKDAPEMGLRLLKDGVKIDAFLSSPAKRAKKTCLAFTEAYGHDKEEIIFIDKLYHASCEIFYNTTEQLDDKFNSIAIFSHNPGITEFVNSICKEMHIENMPTCGVFAMKTNIDHWKVFREAKKEFLFFKYPKEGQ